MRNEMDVAVQPVQPMDDATKGSEETAVKVAAPMRWNHGVRGAFASDSVGEVIDFRVRDVPALTHRGTLPPARFGRHHLQGRPHANNALHWPLPVLAGGLEEPLNASDAEHRFSPPSFAHGPRHPERLPARQAPIPLLDHRPDFWALARHDEVGRAAATQELSQQAHVGRMVENPACAHGPREKVATLKASHGRS